MLNFIRTLHAPRGMKVVWHASLSMMQCAAPHLYAPSNLILFFFIINYRTPPGAWSMLLWCHVIYFTLFVSSFVTSQYDAADPHILLMWHSITSIKTRFCWNKCGNLATFAQRFEKKNGSSTKFHQEPLDCVKILSFNKIL